MTKESEEGCVWDKIEIKGRDSEIFENYEYFKEKVLEDLNV